MKFISKYRRHKFATPVLLLIALSALGFTFSAATAAPNQSAAAASTRSTLIEEGKEIFLKGCSSCHGLNAEGAAIAPSLIGVGNWSDADAGYESASDAQSTGLQ